MHLGAATISASLFLSACGPELWADVDPANLALQRPGSYVVWGRLAEGQVRAGQPRAISYFLDEDGRELSRESAIVLRTGAGDLLWREEVVPTPTEPCRLHCDPGEDCDFEHGPGLDVRASLVPRAGAAISVVEPSPVEPPGEDVMYPREHRRSVSLEASVGPYLFLREQVYEDLCGAHGLGTVKRIVWDLERRAPLQLRPEAADLEQARRIAPRHFDAEAAALASEPGSIGGDEEAPDPGETELTGLLPSFGPEGLRLDYQLSAGACYACSRGDAGDYSRSIRLPAGVLPPALAGSATIPPPVARFLRAHPELEVGGFSLSADR